MASPIENYVKSLLGRFSNDLGKTWYAIKHHPKYKTTTNAIISKTINNVQAYWGQAKDYVKWKANDVLGSKVTVQSATTPKNKITVTYTIPLERGSPTTSHETSKTRTFATEVDSSFTKKQMQAHIKDQVTEWLSEYYSEKDPQTVINNIRIKGLE